MATLDELQAQLTALAQRVNEITAPPDDYYTHRFSGEEIDNAVERVTDTPGSGAITAEDIGAAPSGFGLGELTGGMLSSDNNLDDIRSNGWYAWGSSKPAGAPIEWARMLVIGHGGAITQIVSSDMYGWKNIIVVRSNISTEPPESQFTPWEYTNPPMQLGVEYRTTERYKGKPVYVKLVDCGALPNATYKTVGISGATQVLRVSGTANTGRGIPGFFGSAQDSFIGATPNGGSIMLHAFLDASDKTCECTAWYIKE